MKEDTSKIDPFAGVRKGDVLKVHIRQMCGGLDRSRSYCRGALQFLERHPPNKYIVPLLRKAMQKARYGATR